MVKKLNRTVLIALIALIASGCSIKPLGDDEAGGGPLGAKIDNMEAVTSGGDQQAVLSLHKRYAYVDACKFGLTLTNNLPYKISNISFRFAAHNKSDASPQHVTRNFFEIDPNDRQYRELDFSGIPCDEITYVEITDPGRCEMGGLSRYSSQPGDCSRRVYIAKTPYVRLVHQ